MSVQTAQQDAALAASVAEVLGVNTVRLVAHPAGGSRVAYRVETDDDPQIAFLRLDDGESGMSGTVFDLSREAEVMRRVGVAGIPVPKVLGTLKNPTATILEFVEGTSRLEPGIPDKVGPKFMGWIASTHRLDPSTMPVEQFDTVADAIRADLQWWNDRVAATALDGSPLVAAAVKVLMATIPEPAEAPVFVHGDVGPGNFLVADGRIAAVLDWEMAHVGDHHEDLAWLWMRGAHSDFGDPQRRFAEYEAAGGANVDEDRLRWHLAFVMLKTVIAIRSRLMQPGGDRLVVTQDVLLTVYEALLGWVLADLCGTRHQLLAEEPETITSPELRLFDRAARVIDRDDREGSVAFDRLRLTAAHGPWRAARLATDIEIELGGASDLLALIDAAEFAELAAVVCVVGADADRACWASPPAVRRIRRAQGIGLGTS